VNKFINSLNQLIFKIIDDFKTNQYDESKTNILREQFSKDIISIFSEANIELVNELSLCIEHLVINDLNIGKTHYTKKDSEQTLQEFRDNEILLRIAAEQRAKNKNKIDELLHQISLKPTQNKSKIRLTNIDCFSAYLDRLITEKIKKYNFDKENKNEVSEHQEILCNYINNDIIYLFNDIINNGHYNFIGEKRTFDEKILIENLKKAK
jgi:adenosyl cobinamide kinase/adenosyl cobinamide phosphate guanylyltransferase